MSDEPTFFVYAKNLLSGSLDRLKSTDLFELEGDIYRPFQPTDAGGFTKKKEYGRIIGESMVKYFVLIMTDTKEEREEMIVRGAFRKPTRKSTSVASVPMKKYHLQKEKDEVKNRKKHVSKKTVAKEEQKKLAARFSKKRQRDEANKKAACGLEVAGNRNSSGIGGAVTDHDIEVSGKNSGDTIEKASGNEQEVSCEVNSSNTVKDVPGHGPKISAEKISSDTEDNVDRAPPASSCELLGKRNASGTVEGVAAEKKMKLEVVCKNCEVLKKERDKALDIATVMCEELQVIRKDVAKIAERQVNPSSQSCCFGGLKNVVNLENADDEEEVVGEDELYCGKGLVIKKVKLVKLETLDTLRGCVSHLAHVFWPGEEHKYWLCPPTGVPEAEKDNFRKIPPLQIEAMQGILNQVRWLGKNKHGAVDMQLIRENLKKVVYEKRKALKEESSDAKPKIRPAVKKSKMTEEGINSDNVQGDRDASKNNKKQQDGHEASLEEQIVQHQKQKKKKKKKERKMEKETNKNFMDCEQDNSIEKTLLPTVEEDSCKDMFAETENITGDALKRIVETEKVHTERHDLKESDGSKKSDDSDGSVDSDDSDETVFNEGDNAQVH